MSVNLFILNTVDFVVRKGITLLIGLIILWIGFKIIKKIIKIFNKVLEKYNVDKSLASFLDTLLGVILKLILTFVILEFVGIGTASLAALLASCGLAVGLALQGSLSNFAGGVIILFLKPFKIGDFIQANGLSGTVEKISIFHTYLITPDNKAIFIPNGSLSNGNITNYTLKSLRRVDLTFSIDYSHDIETIKNIISSYLESNESVLKDPNYFVGVSAYGDNSIDYTVRAWCSTENYWYLYQNILENLHKELLKNNIIIPYPTYNVNLVK